MSYSCIPRVLGLAQTCTLDTEYTGTEERCAPVCDGTETVHETVCAQTEEGNFCTFQCDPGNNGVDCLLQPAFADGCCGVVSSNYWCLIPALCD